MKTPGAPDLYALVYVSQASRPLSEDDLEDLLLDARTHNEEVGVTGFLTFERPDVPGVWGSFVQYIEGDRDTIRDLMRDRIRPSSLHHHIDVKRAGPIEGRSFPDWTMAFERTRENALAGFSDLINKLGPPPDRDP